MSKLQRHGTGSASMVDIYLPINGVFHRLKLRSFGGSVPFRGVGKLFSLFSFFVS